MPPSGGESIHPLVVRHEGIQRQDGLALRLRGAHVAPVDVVVTATLRRATHEVTAEACPGGLRGRVLRALYHLGGHEDLDLLSPSQKMVEAMLRPDIVVLEIDEGHPVVAQRASVPLPVAIDGD